MTARCSARVIPPNVIQTAFLHVLGSESIYNGRSNILSLLDVLWSLSVRRVLERAGVHRLRPIPHQCFSEGPFPSDVADDDTLLRHHFGLFHRLIVRGGFEALLRFLVDEIEHRAPFVLIFR